MTTDADPRTTDSAAAPATRRAGDRPTRRPSPSARRFGYLVTIAINIALLVVIHVSPGWDAATFLTDAAGDVVPLLTLSIALTIAVNVVWLFKDRLWLRAAGDLLGVVVGALVSLRILSLFPFTFPDGSLWPTVLRMALWVAIVGGAIGTLANLVALIRALRHPERG